MDNTGRYAGLVPDFEPREIPESTAGSKSDLIDGLCQIDHEFVSEITCPYCGGKDTDSWEHNLRDGEDIEVECGQCDETFNVVCDITITYTSKPKA